MYSQSHDHSGYYVREPVESTFRFRITTAVLTLPNFHPTVIFALGYFSVAKVVELYISCTCRSVSGPLSTSLVWCIELTLISPSACVRACWIAVCCSCCDMSINLSIQSFRPRALRSGLRNMSSGYYHAHYTGMCLQSAWFRRQYPSSCQISWQSVKPLLSYGDLSICSKLRMSTIVTVARALNYRRGVVVGLHRFANFG